jgi:predicted ribosome quality control (RQC) complex YloA/Tae2 family protein
MELRLSSFEIRALVEETSKEIEKAHLTKVQQIGKELFRLSFSTRSGKRDLLVEMGKRFNLTDYSMKAPEKPSQVAIVLRKYLENKILERIEQHGFDRVIVLDFGENKIILEFFSHGNMILTDKNNKIILTFRHEEWKDRKLEKGQTYLFPKGALNPYDISLSEFRKIFTEKDAVRSLVKSLSFGGDYAEEICALAGVEKNASPTDDEKERLYKAMEKILGFKTEPVMQGDRLFPFPLSSLEIQKRFKSMNNAVDEFYLMKQPESQKLKKLRKRLDEQVKALDRFGREADDSRKKGDLIYSNYTSIEKMLDKKKGKFTVELD